MWHKILTPAPSSYAEYGARPGRSDGYATYDNSGTKAETLLVTPTSMSLAGRVISAASQFMPPATFADELGTFEAFNIAWSHQWGDFRKGEKLWEAAMDIEWADGGKAEAEFMRWIRWAPGGERFLPNWLIWGCHIPFDQERLLRAVPAAMASAKVDTDNDWMLAANLDYGSFNLRVAGFLSYAISADLVSPSSMAMLREHFEACSQYEAFELGPGGVAKDFPDGENYGPALFAALERVSIDEAAAVSTKAPKKKKL